LTAGIKALIEKLQTAKVDGSELGKVLEKLG
jgi:hypothetical protein